MHGSKVIAIQSFSVPFEFFRLPYPVPVYPVYIAVLRT